MPDPTLDQIMPTALQHLRSGQLDRATALLCQLLDAQPNHPDALHLLGVIAAQKGRPAEAIDLINRAVALQPAAEYWRSLGVVLGRCHRTQEAIEAFERATALRPDYAEAWSDLGAAYRTADRLDQAQAACERAVGLRPNSAEMLTSLANIFAGSDKFDQAEEAARKALAMRPDLTDAWVSLAGILASQGKLAESLPCTRQAIRLRPGDAGLHSTLLSNILLDQGLTPAANLAEVRAWDARHASVLTAAALPHDNDRDPERKLRIGYVSPFFCAHVIGWNFLPLLRNQDRSRIEIFCYSNLGRPDDVTRQMMALANAWRDVGALSDDAVADMIRADRIDILVDQPLHLPYNRLLVFARKPAPVQVTHMGYPGTTGLTAMDYRITDPFLDPPGEHDADYTEKSIRLPHSFWCYDPAVDQAAPDLEVASLPALSAGHITFGCLNTFHKTSDFSLALWARVLQAVPQSRLLILAPPGQHRQRVAALLSQAGIAPQRIDFVAKMDRVPYFQTYHRIDIGLDSLPYNSHTTALDALWMGVPTVTLVGQTVVGRAGLSHLSNLGLPELIARNSDEFVRIAANLAADLPRLAELRAALRPRMEHSPLMDAKGFARDIEAAYRQMWKTWCESRG